jgi:nucleotide-binding universal stress UspA family protein
MTDNEVGSAAEIGDSEAPRIIVGIDGSESSVKALREGRRLADALGSPLEAVAVWQQSHSMYDFYQSQSGWTPEKDVEKLLRDSRCRFCRASRRKH